MRVLIRHYHDDSATRNGERRVLWNQILRAFTTICDAVASAHARRIIHRDLKPQNVVMGEFGETVVLNGELARTTGGRSRSGICSGQHRIDDGGR
ncbi:MAG: hypothetical protein IID45_02555 [Planctomycetes bacterium]|nr:hypothetical protein [Planctomycetota bacterium]